MTSPGQRLRVIPRLDIKGPNLVKGVHLEGLRVLGKPEAFARAYAELADELLFMDVVASLYGRNSLLDIIERTAEVVFIPLVVGGGLRSLEDIATVLRAGADKVSLNTAAVARPDFVREAAERFGSSTIIVSVEAIRLGDGRYEAFTDNGRERTGRDALEWAVQAAELGAGEIMVTSIDREGTGRGYDLELTAAISRAVDVPVIACGGAGKADHVVQVAREGRAQAACVAAMLHYHLVRQGLREGDFAEEINLAHLERGQGFGRVEEMSLGALKTYLLEQGITGRVEHEHSDA